MSRRLLLALAFLCGVAGTAQGQELEQLERRTRILTARNAQLIDSLKQVAVQAFDQQPRVTVAADGFAISAPEWAVHRLARGAAEKAPRWRERYGSTFESVRDDTLVVWIAEADTGRPHYFRRVEWRFAGVSGKAELLLDRRPGYDPLEMFPAAAVVAWERSLLDPATTAWLWAPVSGAGRAGLIRGAQFALLASQSGPARRCLAGRTEDCERILDLDAPADSLLRWYDPTDRAWARAVGNVRTAIRGRVACTSGKTVADCAALLRAQGIKMPRPVGNVVRESFYRFVIETGGDRAIERFRADSGGTVAEHLSAVAGRPIATLVPEWRVWLDTARPDPSAELIRSVMVAMGWMVVLALLFAWRFRWIRA